MARKKEWIMSWVMTDDERWDFAEDRSGCKLVNELMVMFSQLRDFDTVIFWVQICGLSWWRPC
jgi:hypothetical protein